MNEITVPDAPELEGRIMTWPERAATVSITTQDHYSAAGELLTGIKGLQKEIDETFDPGIKKAHELHRDLLAKKREFSAPLSEAEKLIKDKMSVYLDEQEKKRAEAQRKAEAEARRQAEEQRRAEEEARLAEAAALESAGHKAAAAEVMAEAEAIAEQPIEPLTVVVASNAPKAEGVSSKMLYGAKLVNSRASVEYILANWDQWGATVEINMTPYNALARAQREAFRFPGMELTKTRSMASKAK